MVFGEADMVHGRGVALGSVDGEAEEVREAAGVSFTGVCFVEDSVFAQGPGRRCRVPC
jgi:hypothetical protein